MPSTLVAVAAQAARSSAENARDSPEGLRPTAKIVAVCAKVDGIGPAPLVDRQLSGRKFPSQDRNIVLRSILDTPVLNIL